MAETNFELRLLGPFSLQRNGAETRLTAAAQQLLALLALDGPSTRESLAVRIWPDSISTRSRFYIRRTLVELKSISDLVEIPEEGLLELNRDTVRCDLIEVRLNLESFRPDSDRIVKPLLEGSDYRWLADAREQLSSRLTHGLLRLSSRQEGEEAVQTLQLALQIEPMREQLWRALFRALASSGSHSQIPTFAKAMRRRLAQELGFLPSAETEQLIDDLLKPPSAPSPTRSLLPLSGEPFVGREIDVAEVETLLNERFVTVVGVGGLGKTRLASHIAQKRGTDAYWFSMGYGSAVPLRVVLASHFRSSDADAILFQRLANLSALLVVDNAENLTPSDRSLLGDLFNACPGIQILVTSRERLGLQDERPYFLQPITLPSETVPPSQLAFELFTAYLPKRNKRLTKREIADIQSICDYLGGVPLALKLAALKVRTLSTAAIFAAIRKDVTIIDSQQADPVKSIRAAYEWSFARLSPEAQRLFVALSPLEGIWPEELAFVLGGGPSGNGVFALEELVVAGLVLPTADQHYRSINPLRQFALRRLNEDVEGARDAMGLLVGFFQELARKLASGQLKPVRAYEQGLRFAAEQLMLRPFEENGLQVANLGRALLVVWEEQGDYTSGASWLDVFLSYQSGRSRPEMAEFFLLRGKCATELYDLTGAIQILRRGIGMVRSDPELLFEFHRQLSEVYSNQGALKSAEQELAVALEIAGQVSNDVLRARALQRQAYIAGERQEFELAHRRLDEALGIFLTQGESAHFLSARETLAATLLNEHRLEEAEQVLKDCDARRRQAGQESPRSWLLNCLAEISNRRSDPVAAILYTEEAISILSALGHDQKLVYSLQLQAQAYVQLKDDSRSIELLERVISITRGAGMDAATVLNLSRLADVYEKRGDYAAERVYRSQAEMVTNRVQSSGNWPNAAMNNVEVQLTSS